MDSVGEFKKYRNVIRSKFAAGEVDALARHLGEEARVLITRRFVLARQWQEPFEVNPRVGVIAQPGRAKVGLAGGTTYGKAGDYEVRSDEHSAALPREFFENAFEFAESEDVD